MLVDSFNPFDNLAISALVAAVPILLFLLCLTVLKMKGIYAALLNLGITFIIVLTIFKLPIGYIIVMAVWFYKITVESGKFDIYVAV